MIFRTLFSAAVLALAISASAYAQDAMTNTSPVEQQRQMERMRYQDERTEVRNRLDEQGSVAERNDTGNYPGEPSSLNRTAPSSGYADNSDPVAPGTPPRSYNE